MFKRDIRKLYSEANQAYTHGLYFDKGSRPYPAPGMGPLRIAFDAARKSASAGNYDEMPLEVWALVLADHLRRDNRGHIMV